MQAMMQPRPGLIRLARLAVEQANDKKFSSVCR
jgi:hypothetical protein